MDVSSEYDAHANTINVDDIATNSNNRTVMRRMKRNTDDNNNDLHIQNRHDECDGEECVDYVPEEAYDDMGWLGYFVGKSKHLEELHMKELAINSFTTPTSTATRNVLEPFFRGVSRNKSIQKITFRGTNLLGGEVFAMLTPFFKHNYNLTNIHVSNCDFGADGSRLFALALGSCTHKSLKHVQVNNNNIEDEGMVDIITSLSMFPHLRYLALTGNHLRKNGCVALATLLQCSAEELQYLFISNNDIGDDGIEALLPALANYSHLQSLNVSNNPSITTRGWQHLATILEAPNSNLERLYIARNNINDEVVASFASALTNNNTLQIMNLDNNPSITAVGWQSFSTVLRNTSSINATFASNHTLRYVGDEVYGKHEIIGPLFDLNARNDEKKVAVIKILQCHNDFDMLPFFEWEFKVLPLVLSWFERASACEMPRGFEPNLEERKLSTIYQFVRGMPVLYVETRLRKESEDIKVVESQLEEDKLQKEYMQCKQLLRERKEIIMRKL